MSMKKHALVVGGTRGIGRTIANVLASEEYGVSAIGRRVPPPTADMAPGVRCWPCDIADRERLAITLHDIMHDAGRLDAVVFCQRYRGDGDDWAGEMSTTLESTRFVIDALASHFDREQGGAIVVISSLVGHLVTTEQPLSYHVAKAGLNQLVRYYAVNLGPSAIRVNCVSPATVLKEESRQFYADNERLYNLYTDLSPLRKMATAEDIANVVTFLCSPKSAVITGQNIFVDCGVSLQSQEALGRRLASLTNLKITRQSQGGQSA